VDNFLPDRAQLWLRVKVELLCTGITIPLNLENEFVRKGYPISPGRKGGAGPAGGRYFHLPNGSLVNVQLWYGQTKHQRYILTAYDGRSQISLMDFQKILPDITINLLPMPLFSNEKNCEGIPYSKIALMHGDRTIATTINQRCILWRTNEQCKFCAIEQSVESGSTIVHKTGDQIADAIQAARVENSEYGSHITLTIGSQVNEDQTVEQYGKVIRTLRQRYPDLPIHIQCEPFENLNLLQVLKDTGVTTVGIHLEILDDLIRSYICPGKAKKPKSLYYTNWERAVEIFGSNQVSTFLLTGFGEDPQLYREELREVVKRGVIPIITPARPLSGVKINVPFSSSNLVLEMTLYAAQLCLEFHVNPLKNRAGCVLCTGCSAITDAYEILQNTNN
jgi:radical SAM protein (TIGR04043 family)